MNFPHGGPRCRTCNGTEQDCAWNYGACCDGCSHFGWLDENGNEKAQQVGRPRNDGMCATESGYQAHRYRHELPCQPCREAHTAHNRQRQTA